MNIIEMRLVVWLEKKNKIDETQAMEHLITLLTNGGYKIKHIMSSYLRKESEK